ncbi:MAG: tRNA modification GTPase MnmE [candidate division BRC1 bacterium ADurb.BinA364]|nr:MAG: tRNA modification GTPase MnmE [candidate division BRC1 bacterium ADurb.BinA364]
MAHSPIRAQLPRERDTIAAPATPAGRSALAVLRLSGPDALTILRNVFAPVRAERPWTPWRMRSGWIVGECGEPLDRALAVWMAAPTTHTGEDTAEISCHGSPIIVEKALRACVRQGARLADPGEFTRRAFLNGKISLAEAEAVCDMITAETETALETARRQLAGELSVRISAIREGALDALAEIEAHLDFAEEDIAPCDFNRLADSLDGCSEEVDALLAHSERGRRLRDGARIVAVGRVNVGKSSIFNSLIGMERAISTPHPGTTRDSIEARIDLRGFPVDLVDTAGIRPAADEIEAMGIERAKREIERADLLLWVIDGSVAPNREDYQVFRLVMDLQGLLIVNKSDLPESEQTGAFLHSIRQEAGEGSAWRLSPVRVSAKTRQGIGELEERIAQALGGAGGGPETSALVSNARHAAALESARRRLGDAGQSLRRAGEAELAAVDLRGAIQEFDGILGIDVGDEVLDRIFSRFCIGK